MKKQGLKKIESYIGLGKVDTHMHSNYSDGKPTIEEILDYVENKTDLDLIAITDHDTIEGAVLAEKIVAEKKYRFEVIVGEEISTTDGHIIGLFLTEKIPGGKSCEETVNLIKKQEGLAIASHPFQHTKFSDEYMITMDGIGTKNLFDLRFSLDGVEIVNATPTLADENIAATAFNRMVLRIAETGGSDAHILEAISMGYTVFEGKNAEDFKQAIKNHQTQAIYGRWSILVLFKYLFFFIPLGLRLLWNSAFGRKK